MALSLSLLVLAEAGAQAETRAEADRRAKAFFLGTTFFADGRGMHDAPGLFNLAKRIFGIIPWNAPEEDLALRGPFISARASEYLGREFGFIEHHGRAVGLFETRVSNIPVSALGCVACHSGKAAGVFIPGLGNKGISNSQVGREGGVLSQYISKKASEAFSRNFDPAAKALLQANADRIHAVVSDPSFTSPTNGLIENNVVYKTFYQAFGLEYPSGVKGYVNKVPHLWGMAKKRDVGKFYDGAGDGHAVGWTVAVEIMNGQIEQTIRKPEYLEKVKAIEDAMDAFLPPRYPFGIQPGPRARGEKVFRETCTRCHGKYERDAEGYPIYEAPKLVMLGTVGTDPTRLEFFRDRSFWAAVEASRYADLLRMGPNYDLDRPRYFAPRLDGVWARFPYLHNGSVPTLWAMLNPSERPEAFSVRDAGETHRFDFQRNGLTVSETPRELEILKARAKAGARDVYWVERPGHKNIGHPFGSELLPTQKWDLIEYLKSL